MEKFDLVGFLNGNFAVQCTARKNSRSFLSFLEANRVTWVNQDNATDQDIWSVYEGETCYSFILDKSGIMYSDLDYCEQNNIPVVLL